MTPESAKDSRDFQLPDEALPFETLFRESKRGDSNCDQLIVFALNKGLNIRPTLLFFDVVFALYGFRTCWVGF